MKSGPVLTGFARFLILHFVNRWIQYFVLRFQCLLPVLTFDAQGSPHSHRGKPCLPPAPSSSTASAWYPLPAWRQKTDPRERLERHAAQVLLGPTTTPGLHRPAVWDVSKRSLESSSGTRFGEHQSWKPTFCGDPVCPRGGGGLNRESALSPPGRRCGARCRRGRPAPRPHHV